MNISKVAELAGVSNTTVSFVINGKPGISSDTVEKVKNAIRETGYVPRAASHRKRSELKDCSNVSNIGILMPEGVMSTIPFYARLFEAIHKELDKRDIAMTPIRYGSVSTLSKSSFDDIDGLIFCSYTKDITDIISIPFVSILGHPSVEDKLNADHIEPANDRIGVMAAKHMVEKGHKHLLAINPSISSHPAIETRISYFESFCKSKELRVETKSIPFIERDKYGRLVDGLTIDQVKNFVEYFKNSNNRPTAIFVPIDSHLAILQKAFAAAGVCIGEEVEFIGCNNESILLDGLHPRPATIDVNPQAMARAAIVALLQRIQHPDDNENIYKIVEIEPGLVSSATCVKDVW